jgi:hypothetical protein
MPELEIKPTPPDWERLAMRAPQLDTLLAQAEALTKLARGAWITLTLGCLYVWLTIAALRDIQLFIPEEALTLPILNVDISHGGFFVFAPALLLRFFTRT